MKFAPLTIRLPTRRVMVVATAVAVATLVVHARSLVLPALFSDDFVILWHSGTWPDTRERLWVPVNEHCWPLFRLLTWGVVTTAGGAASLPLVCALATRLALLGTVWLVYLFVRRERGRVFVGLAAAAAFGVTAVYQEAVFWYAASPAVWAAGVTVFTLLGAQRWKDSRSWVGLVGTAVGSAVAPAWFGGGVLTGPLCGLYLLLAKRWGAAAVPLLGTAAFLTAALTMTGDRLTHADHHGSRSTLQALDPIVGATNTVRSIVDNLAFGAAGIAGFACPLTVAVVLFLGVAAGVAWWLRRAPRRDLVVLGLAFVALHYGLIYSARAAWPYDTVLHTWSRYNLFPWLGVVIAVSGGLRDPAVTAGSADLTAREVRRLLSLVVVLVFVNLPRGIIGTTPRPPDQPAVLQRVEDVERKCRAGGVPADAARRVLGALPAPGDPLFNAYLLMRQCDPVSADMPDAEVRARLGLP